jgi:DNA-binding NarL/FixJ family response regulator
MDPPIRVVVAEGAGEAGRRIAGILAGAGDVELVDARFDRLTPRERQVLALVARADTNAAIAEELGITTRAVERHVNSIFRKLEIPADGSVNRRVRAALTYQDALASVRFTPGG